MIRVLVADDQATVRDGLVTLLGLADGAEVVGTAADGVAAGAAHCRAAARRGADGPADVAAGRGGGDRPDRGRVAGHGGAGAHHVCRRRFARWGTARRRASYLTKDAGRAELAAAVRSVASGQATFAKEIADRLVRGFAAAAAPPGLRERFPALTAREADVLEAITLGHNNARIAADLFHSMATVKSYINSIFAKLGARDRAHATAIALGRSE